MINPTDTTALHSLDFGSVYTPDGREHPVTAMTLPHLVDLIPTGSQPSSSDPVDPPSTYPATGPTAPVQIGQKMADALTGSILPSMPSHFGARFVAGLVGVIILAIVVWRLLR